MDSPRSICPALSALFGEPAQSFCSEELLQCKGFCQENLYQTTGKTMNKMTEGMLTGELMELALCLFGS